MKKFLTTLIACGLALCFSLAMSGCSSKDDNALYVGMECGYQPYNWTQFDNSNGAVSIKGKIGQYANGYDVKIAKRIAEELGKELVIVQYEWESLVPGVESGALDLIIAVMSPTADRMERVDFSDPYYSSNLVVVVRKDGNYANAESIIDFAGANLVAQMGTFHDEVIDQIAGVVHGTPMDDFPTMITALNAGSIDGYIAEQPGAIADCNGNSNFKYIPLVNNENGFTIQDLSNVTLAVGLQKGSALLSEVNRILAGISTAEQQRLMEEAIAQVPAN